MRMKSPVPLGRLKLRGVVAAVSGGGAARSGSTEPSGDRVKHEIFLSVAFEIDRGNWFTMLY
jgi:hypothetical protein